MLGDLLRGPDLKSPLEDARLDLSDVFAFATPDHERSILMLNANPEFDGESDAYHADAVYLINVGSDNDLLTDIAFRPNQADSCCAQEHYMASNHRQKHPDRVIRDPFPQQVAKVGQDNDIG